MSRQRRGGDVQRKPTELEQLWLDDAALHLRLYKQRWEHIHDPTLLRVAFRSKIRAQRVAIQDRKELMA